MSSIRDTEKREEEVKVSEVLGERIEREWAVKERVAVERRVHVLSECV